MSGLSVLSLYLVSGPFVFPLCVLYSSNVGRITFRCLYVFHVSGRGAVRFPAVKRRFPTGKTYVSR